jgi:hypothetical protein
MNSNKRDYTRNTHHCIDVLKSRVLCQDFCYWQILRVNPQTSFRSCTNHKLDPGVQFCSIHLAFSPAESESYHRRQSSGNLFTYQHISMTRTVRYDNREDKIAQNHPQYFGENLLSTACHTDQPSATDAPCTVCSVRSRQNEYITLCTSTFSKTSTSDVVSNCSWRKLTGGVCFRRVTMSAVTGHIAHNN